MDDKPALGTCREQLGLLGRGRSRGDAQFSHGTPLATLLRPPPGPRMTDGEIQALEVRVTVLTSPAVSVRELGSRHTPTQFKYRGNLVTHPEFR